MNIAFLGDSITYGYDLKDKSRKYSTLVCEMLGAVEENYGITGTLMAMAGLNRDNDKAFLTRINLIDNADVAVVFGGTNDYFWSDRVIDGDGGEYFSSALRMMAEHIKAARGDKPTLFVTPYPHNGIGNFFGGSDWRLDKSRHNTDEKNFNGHSLIDYVEKIVEICEEYSFPCLNLHDGFYFDWEKHTTDGCHPNEEGHILIANAVAAKIKELI